MYHPLAMSFQVTVLQVLVASPADPVSERQVVKETVHAWNEAHAESTGVVLLPLLWEDRCYPLLGDRPQSVINSQIVDRADLVVAIFSTRIGTSTGEDVSGTVEEIRRCLAAGKSVMVYFNAGPVSSIRELDLAQVEALNEQHRELSSLGLTWDYHSPADLSDRLSRQLLQWVRDNFAEARPVDTNTKNYVEQKAREAAEDVLLSVTNG